MYIKKIFTYLLYLLPWFISAIIFKSDNTYYNSLNLPIFAPPPIVFAIIWPILYSLIAFTIYKVYPNNNNYKLALIINYISNQLYTFFFFTLKTPYLALIDTIIVLISSIYLYNNTNNIDNKTSKLLIPYIIWNTFATILSLSIALMN